MYGMARFHWWQRRLIAVSRQLAKRMDDEKLQAKAYSLWEMALRHQSILHSTLRINNIILKIIDYMADAAIPATHIYLRLAGSDACLDYLNVTHIRYHKRLQDCFKRMEHTESDALWRKCEQESLYMFNR